MPLSIRLVCCAALMASMCLLTSNAFAKSGASGNNNVKVSHFKDWTVRCPKSGSNQDDCEMTQLVKSPKNHKPILRVIMGYPPQIDSPAMIFILPLGTRLAPGVQLSVDGDTARHFPFQICLKQGCRADYPIKNALLKKLKHGRKATVTIMSPRGKRLNLDISLSGFTAANRKISS